MFDAPFAMGSGWTAADEAQHTRVVVLGATLAQRLFPAGNALGNVLSLNERDYRVVGVLQQVRASGVFD